MDKKFIKLTSKKNPKISVKVLQGHFATASAHRSNYVDIFDLISSSSAAREAARQLALPYIGNSIDVIIHMDSTSIIAAYLADQLLQSGLGANVGGEIHLITPMTSVGGNFIFHQSVLEKIKGKNAVLIVATMSTGATANQMLECLTYYGCKVIGISAVFSAFPEVGGRVIHSLFDNTDIPKYTFYSPSECPMCKEGRKIDAIIDSGGYTKL